VTVWRERFPITKVTVDKVVAFELRSAMHGDLDGWGVFNDKGVS